jgi:formate dehydrogenase subunit gamma
MPAGARPVTRARTRSLRLELLQIVVGRHHEGRHEALALVQAVLAHPQGRRRLTRFTVSQRYQHWILVLLFTALAATGFPMKFADRPWAHTVVDTLGGLHVTRTIHHWAGVALVLGFLAHLVYALPTLLRIARQPTADGRPLGVWRAVWKLPMVIPPSEVRKAVQLMGYLLGLRREPPTFGRFSAKEKFEYIGVFWGTTLLGLTGLLLWGEQAFSRFFSGRVLNIALIAHTYEAFLAIIHVGILHIVNVIFSPHVFPLSRATITGRTPVAELADAHSDFVEEAARDLGVVMPENAPHG